MKKPTPRPTIKTLNLWKRRAQIAESRLVESAQYFQSRLDAETTGLKARLFVLTSEGSPVVRANNATIRALDKYFRVAPGKRKPSDQVLREIAAILCIKVPA